MDRSVTIFSSASVLVSCVVGVWLGRISVVPSIVVAIRESATPDSKENKEADAGSLSKAFSVQRVVVRLFVNKA